MASSEVYFKKGRKLFARGCGIGIGYPVRAEAANLILILTLFPTAITPGPMSNAAAQTGQGRAGLGRIGSGRVCVLKTKSSGPRLTISTASATYGAPLELLFDFSIDL